MAYVQFPSIAPSFFNNNGSFLANGVLKAYEAGTSTPVEFYAYDGTSLGTSITLNARGEFDTEVFLDDSVSYKFVLDDMDGVQLWERDHYTPPRYFGDPTLAEVDTLVDLKLATTGQDYFVRGRTAVGDGNGGIFIWRSGDQSANVSADSQSGVWAAPSSASTGASGAWQRLRQEGAAYAPYYGIGSGSIDTLSAHSTYGLVLTAGAYTTTDSATWRETAVTPLGTVTLNGLPLNRTREPAARPLAAPAGFGWTPPIAIYPTADGSYRTTLDPWVFERASKTANTAVYYVNKHTGDNANPGTDPSAPKATLGLGDGTNHGALRQVILNGDTEAVIYVAAGVYYRDEGFEAQSPDANVTIICEPGTIITTAERPSVLTWTSVGAGTYSAPRSAVSNYYGALDLKFQEDDGTPSLLTVQASSADVQANAGSYYTDGTTVWVHTQDGRSPDANLLILLTTTSADMNVSSGKTWFISNATMWGGGGGCFDANLGTSDCLILTNCEFAYSTNADGLTTEAGALIIVHRCRAHHNWNDGLNYHDVAAAGTAVLEVDCRSWANGLRNTGSDSQNGSTAHEGIRIVRVNTHAWGNNGPNIVDVGNGETWCVGCAGADSQAASADVNANFWFGQTVTGNRDAWLDGCCSDGSTYDIGGDADGAVYVRNWNGGYDVSPLITLSTY